MIYSPWDGVDSPTSYYCKRLEFIESIDARARNARNPVPMSKPTQLLVAVVVLGLIDAIVPFFPILGLILIYVILDKPVWFMDFVREVYGTNTEQ